MLHIHIHILVPCIHMFGAGCSSDKVEMLPAINIAPMLSTLTMTGSLIEIFVFLSSWISNLISFTASDKAIYSDSKLNIIMLPCTFDCQEIGTPKTYKHNYCC